MYDKDLIKIYNRILSTLVNSLYTIYTHYIISQVVKPCILEVCTVGCKDYLLQGLPGTV